MPPCDSLSQVPLGLYPPAILQVVKIVAKHLQRMMHSFVCSRIGERHPPHRADGRIRSGTLSALTPPSAVPQRGVWRGRSRSRLSTSTARSDARVGGPAYEGVNFGIRM